MTQPTFTQIRAALAAQLNTIAGLRAVASRNAQISPPAAVVMPVTGTFVRYSTTFDGECDLTLRAILLVAEGDSTSGQDLMDAYLATTGPQSVYAAVQADPTLGGVVSWAAVTEATGYGLMNWAGIDYLACHFIITVGI
jgi:hypothetical protein